VATSVIIYLYCHQGSPAPAYEQDDCPQFEHYIRTNSDARTWSDQVWWPAWHDIWNICSGNHDYSSTDNLQLKPVFLLSQTHSFPVYFMWPLSLIWFQLKILAWTVMYNVCQQRGTKMHWSFKFSNYNLVGFCCYKHGVFLIVCLILMKIPSSLLKMMCSLP
jgi:hypothetical protein